MPFVPCCDTTRQELDDSIDALPAKGPTTALAMEATPTAIGPLSGTHQPMAELLYDSGLRLMEYPRLRVKSPDSTHGQIIVGDGRG